MSDIRDQIKGKIIKHVSVCRDNCDDYMIILYFSDGSSFSCEAKSCEDLTWLEYDYHGKKEGE
jgi:hypothetical protein